MGRLLAIAWAAWVGVLALPAAAETVVVDPVAETVFVDQTSSVRYLPNLLDPGLGTSWIERTFHDSTWTVGQFGVGYDLQPGGSEAWIASPIAAGTLSVYTRTEFDVASLAGIGNLFLGIDFDDGIVAWINGAEVYRSPGMPAGPPAWNAMAPAREAGNGPTPSYTYFDIGAAALPALRSGTNVLAIGVWNTGPDSSDLVVAARLLANGVPTLVRGPYLQSGTSSGAIVRWRTDLPTDSRVVYGTDPGNLSLSVVDAAPVSEHIVTLSGLAPNTRYYYAVGSSSQILGGGTADSFVWTAPPSGTAKPTRVWILGDSGTADANVRAVRDAYYALTGSTRTDLWLMLGDNAYPNGSEADYQAALFDVFPDMLRKSVLWPTLGNHDANSADSETQYGTYYDIFSLPAQAQAGGVPSGTEAYYSFDYANIHFVVLDSQDTNRQPLAPMLVWLQQDLASTNQEWIIAFWHHPPYSKGLHDSDVDIEEIEMRQWVVPILDEYGVDLTLTGHSHSYERSWPIVGHYGLSSTFDASMKVDAGDGREDGDGPYQKPATTTPYSGIVHTVCGSSGQTSGGTLDHVAMLVSWNELGSVILDVNGPRLDLKFIGTAGQILDHFTTFKGPVILPPVAAFSAQPTTGKVPFAVAFTDASQNVPDTWRWDFENDGSWDSTSPSPVHPYTTPGLFSVRLAVSNVSGADTMLSPNAVCAHDGPPGATQSLHLLGDHTTMTWSPVPAAVLYDLYKGDLASLRTSGGDFGAAARGCIEDDGTDTQAVDPEVPLPNQAFVYLVRASNCAGQTGTWNEGGAQLAPRDPTIGSGALSCACSVGDDADQDAVCDAYDGCTDVDGDGFGDPGYPSSTCVLDNCPATANPPQTDADTDGLGDACDTCSLDPANDADTDGVCGDVDNCPTAANALQADFDADGSGDACDTCTDTDHDDSGNPGFPGNTCALDNCPTTANPTQIDADTDGLGDACDTCPLDPANDADADERCANVDNCPTTANPAQTDADSDGLGDDCDVCPLDAVNDVDADGVCGSTDNCPTVANPGQQNGDLDAAGDACDPCTDPDGDGFGDPGSPATTCAIDNCPAATNPNQADLDGDGDGDVCDNCPNTQNAQQFDADEDGTGDACDFCQDTDHDGFGNPEHLINQCPDDNCPYNPNVNQVDQDSDGLGDVCDPCRLDALNDADNDFLCANLDNCPQHTNPSQVDQDGDGDGDPCDHCPLDPLNDLDGDNACGDIDPDDDNDGTDDEGDCQPLLRGVSMVPDPIAATLRVSRQGTGVRLRWLPSYQGHLANVYRGSWLSRAPWNYDLTCESPDTVAHVLDLADGIPSAGETVFYLVSARNLCGDSPAGVASNGTPVSPATACPAIGLDRDLDGTEDSADNCPVAFNPLQFDSERDFVGNDCDNCPFAANPSQADKDADGLGDACDPS